MTLRVNGSVFLGVVVQALGSHDSGFLVFGGLVIVILGVVLAACELRA